MALPRRPTRDLALEPTLNATEVPRLAMERGQHANIHFVHVRAYVLGI